VPDRYEVVSEDGTAIPVFKSGRGRPLILVHGGSGDHTTWDPVLPYLEPHRTILAIDRRNGFIDPSVQYGLEREFEDLAAVACDAGSEVELLGASSGALCALGAAGLVPNLRRLALFEPPLIAGKPPTPGLRRLVELGELEAAAQLVQRDLLKVSPEAITERMAAPGWARYVSRIGYFVREEAVVQAWQPDIDALERLAVPILLLVGGDTPAGHHHRGYVKLLESAGADLTVAEIPGQEHFAPARAPELFARLVLDFLEAE
jgi:pimeloyl-ACP methyl ester carboxylesterase